MDEDFAVKAIEKMVEFMDNTNKIIADLKLQLNNQQIDIDKLRKELRKPSNRILTLS